MGPIECPTAHAQKVKESLQIQRRPLDNLHRIEKAQAARQAKTDSLQDQIIQVTQVYVKWKEELDSARTASDKAQEGHRQLLDEAEESIDCGLDEDQDMQDIEAQCESVKDDPAVIAGKRSYLHALLGAKKRKADEQNKHKQENKDTGPEKPRGPTQQGEGQEAAGDLLAGVAGASEALASATGDGSAAAAAMETLQKLTGALAKATYAAPRPKAAPRSAPYGASGG